MCSLDVDFFFLLSCQTNLPNKYSKMTEQFFFLFVCLVFKIFYHCSLQDKLVLLGMNKKGSSLPLKVLRNVSDVIHCSLQTVFHEFCSKVG